MTRPTFSEKILARRKARRSNRVANIVTTWCVVAIALMVGGQFYFGQRQSAIVAKEQARRSEEFIAQEAARTAMITAPTWAAFTMAGDKMQSNDTYSSNLPRILVINGERWNVVEVHNMTQENVNASTYCEHRTIAFLSRTLHSEQRNDIMHEVFHAGACLHGGDTWWNSEHPTANSHPGVYHLGDFMTTFLHDNKEFAAWMAE